MDEERKTIIVIDNCYSRIEGFEPPSLFELLGQFVPFYRKVNDPNTGQKVTKRFVKSVSLFNPKYRSFPTGLTSLVYSHCKKYTPDVEIRDKRIKPESKPFPLFKEVDIREQLENGFNRAIDKGRGIFKLSVAVGKTRMACKIIASLGVKSLYIVPNKGLLLQTYNEFKEHIDTSIGMIGDEYKDYVFKKDGECYIPDILIVTVQSLWRIYNEQNDFFNYLVDNIQLLLFDEAHHTRQAGSGYSFMNTWYILALKFKNAYYRFAMTATLYEDIGLKMLIGATGRVQDKLDRAEAEKEGIVCPFDAWIYRVNCPSVRGWWSSYRNGIILNEEHNRMVVTATRILAEMGRHVLVIFDEIEEHLIPISKQLPEAMVLTGKDSASEREYVQKLFTEGKVNIILTTVMSEGVNVPMIDAIVLASGKGADDTAHIKVTQRIGRGSRVVEGKDNLIVVDFLHVGNTILYNHSMNRIRVMKELGGNIIYKNEAVFQ
jgi:superfamily II DNA or RNA helicase